jgi:hypothetical protein
MREQTSRKRVHFWVAVSVALLSQVCVLLTAVRSTPTTRYTSPAGSGSTCSAVSPCALQTALSAMQPGDTTLLVPYNAADAAATTYRGFFTISADCTAGARCTVKTDPAAEWPALARIDGFQGTTLAAGLTNSTADRTVVLTDGTYFAQGAIINVGTEAIILGAKSGTAPATYTLSTRAAAGTDVAGTPQTHSSGADVARRGQTLTLSGDYIDFRDIEITSSNTKRYWNYADNTSSADSNMPGTMVIQGTGNRVINCVVHDMGDGVNASANAGDLTVYGVLAYNMGWRGIHANDRPPCGEHGTAIYMQGEGAQRNIIANIVLDAFSVGMKGYGTSSGATGFLFDKNVIAGSSYAPCLDAGAPFDGKQNLEVATESVIITSTTVTNNHLYHRDQTIGLNLWLGNVVGNLTATVTGNTIGGGTKCLAADYWTTLLWSNNRCWVTAASGGSAQRFISTRDNGSGIATSLWTGASNEYRATSATARRFQHEGTEYTFDEWKAALGIDATSTFSTTQQSGIQVTVIPNEYQTGRSTVVVWQLDPAAPTTSATVDFAGVIPAGANYKVVKVEDWPNVLHSGTYTACTASTGNVCTGSGGLTLTLNNTARAQPSGDWATVLPSFAPRFNVFIVDAPAPSSVRYTKRRAS